MVGEHKHDTASSEARKDHERVSCGLFWAVGKYKPTNHMIVSTSLLWSTFCYAIALALTEPGTVLTALIVCSFARGP